MPTGIYIRKPADIEERLFRKTVVTSDGCRLRTTSLSHNGYGTISLDGKTQSAHTASFKFYNGPIPTGMEVMHTCDNRACIEPTHLILGTHKQNMADMCAKGRQGISANGAKLRCPQGHEYSKENTFMGNSGRRCRICDRNSSCKTRIKRAKMRHNNKEIR